MNTVMGPIGRVSVILLIGLIGADAAEPPRGAVRAQGRAVADQRGPFNALGATLFWAAWGYNSDRARLERNLATLSEAGFDYVRVLGSVGGPGWTDRTVDPRSDDYDAVVAGLTDLVYDRYGMRTQWTVFGGAPFTPAGAVRARLIDRFAKLAKGREHKIFAFEIANEARSTGFSGPEGIAELRRLGKRLNDQTSVLVALTAPSVSAACETYAGAGADVATFHYERSFGREGPLRPLRRPWSYPAAYDVKCRGELPQVVFNNEPIGPESSVRQDADPSRIAAGFVLTFLARNAAYVLHAGPGIRGGGAADRAIGRHASFDELPSFNGIAAALAAAKQYLPAGLANWRRHEPNSATAPLYGPDRVYAASSEQRFVALVLGTGKTMTLRSRGKWSIDLRQAATGKTLRRLQVGANESLTLPAHDALILIGRGTIE